MKVIPRAGKKLSVLIVDDEADIRESLRSFLELMECFSFIVEARDGQDAFMKVQNQGFDLIITDLIMPKASGNDLIRNIMKYKKSVKTPILILSANLTSDEVEKAMESGVKHALTKPCTAQSFIDKVSSILSREKSDKVKVLDN